MRLRTALACLFTFGLGTAMAAEPTPHPPDETLWGLGVTGMLCYREPCPWHGVFPIAADGIRGRPLSPLDQRDPPPLRASAADRARIETAFSEGGCVVAQGHFEAQTLVVRRIVGDCAEL